MGNKGGATPSGPVLALAKVTKGVIAPAAGAEPGALYLECQGAGVALGGTLGAMGCPQLPTPVGHTCGGRW